jgi:hypothetical protein
MAEQGLTIEARIMRSLSGHYYGSAILRGCLLHPVDQKSNVVDRQRYDFYLTGRAAVAPFTILTYWTATGVFAEVEYPDLWILQVVPDAAEVEVGFHERWHFGIKGPLVVLAHADGEDPVTQLGNWWKYWAPKNGGQNEIIARWLGEQLGRRPPGENPPACPYLILDSELRNPPFFPDEAWNFDLPK